MINNAPTLEAAIYSMIQSYLSEYLHTSTPGIVETYDKTKQLATIQPALNFVSRTDKEFKMPKLVNVPVCFPKAQNSFIHFPLEKGDTGLLVFTERSIDKYMQDGEIAAPSDKGQFELKDACFFPGMSPKNKAVSPQSADNLEINHHGQIIAIRKDGSITIGKNALFRLVSEAFKITYNIHTHPSAGSPPSIGLMTDADLTSDTRAT